MIHIAGGGSAVITASQAGNALWNPATIDVPQTLIVIKANQTIAFSVLPLKTYGDIDFTPAATASSGLSVSFASDNPAVATIVSGKIHIVGSGSAVITASQAGNANYNPASDVPQTLTVNKVNLTFTADNKTKVFQQPNPALTYIITGFVNGETQSVLDGVPSIQTTALQNSPVGTYPITVTGGNDNSYSYVYVAGTLTITRDLQTITFTAFPEKLLQGDSFTLTATSTSGLTVLFESMNTALATVSVNQLTGVSKGMVVIRAYNAGDINYEPAEVFDTVEIYSTHKDIMFLFTPNNDGFNDLWELPQLSVWGTCDVRVFNRWGKLVFANPDYHNEWDGTWDGNPVPEGPYYFVIKTEKAGVVSGTVNVVR
jgi:gliding motility-associated-like protein